MSDFKQISKQMREDWDRRIAHDYRFWMTESHVDDVTMWQSGQRDLDILLEGVPRSPALSGLEVGCGIGRLLKAATRRFGRITGVDVSEKAISKAREFIASEKNAEFIVGDGYSLKEIQSGTIDVAYSFAAITSMPVEVMANYFCELRRVLRESGTLRMQMYIGEEQLVLSNDTLHLRCFKRENLQEALYAAGFELEFIKELVLPFQVSFKEIGIEAVIISARPGHNNIESSAVVAEKLMPGGEVKDNSAQKSNDIECWMSLNYAQDLAQRGDIEHAKRTLEYAQSFVKTATIDISDLLNKVVSAIEAADNKQPLKNIPTNTSMFSSEIYEKNMRVIRDRFSETAKDIETSDQNIAGLEARQTQQGAVIFYNGLCLDHADKPIGSADAWVKRCLSEKRVQEVKKVAIFGFAGGYHVEALLRQVNYEVAVIEPDIAVFKLALGTRDLSGLLSSIAKLELGQKNSYPWLNQDYELLVRAQTQSLHSSQYTELKSLFYGKRALSQFRPNIAVMGPMQGGTLPIMGYCARALVSLGQKTRMLDMSCFEAGYHNLEKFVFDKMRRSGIEGTYVETMAQVALESFNEKPIDILICMAQAPMTGRVLTELRRRGVITVLWFVEDYLRFQYWKDIAQYYDFIFTIQKGDCVSAIKAAGAGHVEYLPVACDPMVHAPLSLGKEEKERWGSKVSFVGAGYHNRQQMFAAICELPFKIWGTEWPECKPFDRLVQEGGRRLTPEEYIKIFNASDINLNLHSSSERDGVDPGGDFVNPRTFELASSNAFQLTDERSLLSEVFEVGKEIVTFHDLNDLREKINYYLTHEDERKQVVQRARERVLREHTYAHRIQQMLTIIYSRCYERLKEREEKSPWKKMLQRAQSHPELLQRCQVAFDRGEEPSLDALISDIVQGNGKLSDTERLLLFLFHVRKQIIRMKLEEKV
jgi:spore maturation protein CgeB